MGLDANLAHDVAPHGHPEVRAERGCRPDRVQDALRRLEGRWKLSIVHLLFENQALRFSELQRAMPAISHKVLTQQLKALEGDGILQRTVYPGFPPHVDYRLTPAGRALQPALRALQDWGAGSNHTVANGWDRGG